MRIGVLAALLFTVANWIGQGYYAPQALAFTLTLGIHVILLRAMLVHDPEGGPWLVTFLTRAVRAVGRDRISVAPIGWSRRAAVATVLALHTVVVVSHQLTPYMLIIGVGNLVVLRFVRPRSLLLGLLALALGYLAVNYGYVAEHFGVFTSFDPFANAERSDLYAEDPLPGKVVSARASQLLTAMVFLGGAAAGVRLLRLGHVRASLLSCALGAAPILVVFGQSYGGEALFRVYLFALPWLAILIAW